jgi:hypothetical protein
MLPDQTAHHFCKLGQASETQNFRSLFAAKFESACIWRSVAAHPQFQEVQALVYLVWSLVRRNQAARIEALRGCGKHLG